MENNRPAPMDMPELKLEMLFYLEATCDPIIPVGDVGKGILNIYPIRGGYFEGEKIRGTILPIGADWNYMYSDGIDVMDTRYALKTDDDAIISISTNGRYIIEPELDQALDRGEYIDPNRYYFRQHLFFETSAEKYRWLNGAIAFAIMAVKPTGEICYTAYRLV